MKRDQISILVLGASYGLVLGLKASWCGHRVDFVCMPREVDFINEGKASLKIRSKTTDHVVTLGAKDALRSPSGVSPCDVKPAEYDICILAMQEPQYSAPEIADLIAQIAHLGLPIISIMNMPLPPFLSGRLKLDLQHLASAWHNTKIWADIDPLRFSAASPDPQATIASDSEGFVVSVNHAANIKVSPFNDVKHQRLLNKLSSSLEALRVSQDGVLHEVGVRFVAHSHPLVAMAKWPMLITGNFRCCTGAAPIAITDAVNNDRVTSKKIYEWVASLCQKLAHEAGYSDVPLVPFERYADAASSLILPSSLARGLHNGATRVERVDKLVKGLALGHGMKSDYLEEIISRVESALSANTVN